MVVARTLEPIPAPIPALIPAPTPTLTPTPTPTTTYNNFTDKWKKGVQNPPPTRYHLSSRAKRF